MAGFKGQAENTIDSKGRMPVPAKLRDFLPSEARKTFVVTQGMESCIVLYPANVWDDEIEPMVNGLDMFSREEAMLARRMLMWCDEVTMDGQHRVSFPADLMELVGLAPGDKAKVLGVGNRIEVWAPAAFAAYLNGSSLSAADLAEKHMSRKRSRLIVGRTSGATASGVRS